MSHSHDKPHPHLGLDHPIGFWENRYAETGWAYGAEPNDFVRECADRLAMGRVLCLGEGQGRNAVFLAARGFEVTAMDQSPMGLARARELAAERGVQITTVAADLADFPIEPLAFTAIVSVFVHLPRALRREVHQRVMRGLAVGGAYVLEAYSPAQVHRQTGGPSDPALLASLDDLREELFQLEFDVAHELVRPVNEGRYHVGSASTIQILARRTTH